MDTTAPRTAKRLQRIEELRAHLEAGGSIRQGGTHDDYQPWMIWPACSPFMAQWNTPEYLAYHLENREYGLRFETEIVHVYHTT